MATKEQLGGILSAMTTGEQGRAPRVPPVGAEASEKSSVAVWQTTQEGSLSWVDHACHST